MVGPLTSIDGVSCVYGTRFSNVYYILDKRAQLIAYDSQAHEPN